MHDVVAGLTRGGFDRVIAKPREGRSCRIKGLAFRERGAGFSEIRRSFLCFGEVIFG